MTQTDNTGSGQKRKSHSLSDAINFFNDERSDPKIRGNEKLSKSLAIVEEVAKDSGLTADQITTLVSVVTSGRFSQQTSQKLIKCLIPRDSTPSTAVISAISGICTNVLPIVTQSLLVRWIILVYDSIDNIEDLHAVYGILFYFLENETLCPHVAHLLFLLTKKEDVKLFRVQKLLSLQEKMGPQPYIMGLLSIYKLHCPNLVAIVIPRAKTVYFRQYDRVWRNDIQRVQERQKENRTINDGITSPRSGTSPLESATKRTRYDLVPCVSTVTFNKRSTREHITTSLDVPLPVPVEQITNFKEFLKCIDRIELPRQIGSCLNSHYLQHAISLFCDEVVDARLGYWLHSILHEEFINNCDEKSFEKKEQFLKVLLSFADFIQEGIPMCETFLIHYLQTWNGKDFLPYIFELVTKLRLYSFDVLYDLILEPLRSLYVSSSVYFKCQSIVCFTKLLHNLTLFELTRYEASVEHLQRQTTTEMDKNIHCMFSTPVHEFQPHETLSQLIEFIDDLCTVGLIQEKNNTLLLYYVLEFYDVVSKLFTQYNTEFVKIPTSSVFYRVLFSHDALAISKLGHVMTTYRSTFSQLKAAYASKPTKTSDMMGVSSIPALNLYIKDICNALWQKRAFVQKFSESNSVFESDLVKDLNVPHINAAFSSINHQAFLPFVYKFLEEKDVTALMRNTSYITKTNKMEYMDFLQQENLVGFKEFITTHIRPSTSSESREKSFS